ncbi:hypothetical protein AB0M20_43550 [Actinoplanes sp. NPDC051633]|uniref:hypothetical protein n=1 Tax=Actinoplanes sp. NPDC051633 TaxID=3155670 RepID=UPI00341C765A
MTRVGCTGHQGITASTRRAVSAAIAQTLADLENGLEGLSSLAEGSDQVFALAVLAAGGKLHVVIPSRGYEETFAADIPRATYRALVALAQQHTTLPFTEPGEDAYLAAGQHIVDHSDVLLAVWDGQDAAGKGGTGDVVAYAYDRGLDVRVIWPRNARRSA